MKSPDDANAIIEKQEAEIARLTAELNDLRKLRDSARVFAVAVLNQKASEFARRGPTK